MHVGCKVIAKADSVIRPVEPGDRGVVVEDLLFGWWRVRFTCARGITSLQPVMYPQEVRMLHPLELLAGAAEE